MFRLFVGPFLGSFGKGAVILRPRGIEGIGNVHIGDRTYIFEGALLAAVPRTGQQDPKLLIGQGCSIGRNNHFYATDLISIGDNVLTAANVYIADNSHTYTDVNISIKDQPIKQLSRVLIGEGTWIGQNACIIGACIGRGCVIGANSVVLDDVPDHSVVVGSPARIVRRFELDNNTWRNVPSFGDDCR